MTYTYVELEVPAEFYDFVVKAMIEAGYGHVFDVGVKPEVGKDCGPIDMRGLALTRQRPIPGDWTAVRKDPTPRMIAAGLRDAEGFNVLGISEAALAEAYKRMIGVDP